MSIALDFLKKKKNYVLYFFALPRNTFLMIIAARKCYSSPCDTIVAVLLPLQ